MGSSISFHQSTIDRLEEKRSKSLEKYQEFKLEELVAKNLKPNLSADTLVLSIDQCKAITKDHLPCNGKRGSHYQGKTTPPVAEKDKKKKKSKDSEDGAAGDAATPPAVVTYEECIDRVYNKDSLSFPLLIVRVKSTSDVVAVIAFAKEVHAAAAAAAPSSSTASIPPAVSIASGCHSGVAFVDGSIAIDFCEMRSCTYSDESKNIVCESGALVDHLDVELAPLKRFVPTGTNPYTGIAGSTLAGGVGYLTAFAGMSCDSLIEVEGVLADGTVITANDENEHADLIMACRGGGLQLGVVTKMTFKTHAIPQGGKFLYGEIVPMCPTEYQKQQVIKNYVAAVESWRGTPAERENMGIMVLPCGAPVIPTTWTNWSDKGALDGGIKELPELKKATKDLGGLFTAKKEWKHVDFYSVIQRALIEHQVEGFHAQSLFGVNEFSAEVQQVLFNFTNKDIPNKLSAVVVFPLLGQAHGNPEGDAKATPLVPAANRNLRARYWLLVEAKWEQSDKPDDARAAVYSWLGRLKDAMEGTGHVTNTTHAFSHFFTTKDGEGSSFSVAKPDASLQEQFKALKQKYDPEGFWQVGPNRGHGFINQPPPTTTGPAATTAVGEEEKK